ncbi:MAG: hypothetical protein K1W19_08325 [Lachnospiraceae bacterium]
MNSTKYCNYIRCTDCSYYEECMEDKIESEVKKGKLSFEELKNGVSSISTNNNLKD